MAEQRNGNGESKSVADGLKEMFFKDNVKSAVEKVLPEAFKGQAERFLSRALLTFHNSEPEVRAKLSKCKPQSFITAVCTAAECGFALDNYFAYMIPYGNVCQCEFDYKAIVTRARRSGSVSDIRPQVVYENDKFEYWEEDGRQRYKHSPYLDGHRGEMKGAYAVATFPSGGFRFGYMNKEDLDKVHQASKAPNSPAWKKWKDQMWCKAVIKRVAKGLLDDPGVIRIIELDNEMYDPDKVVEGKVTKASSNRRRSLDELADEAEGRTSPRIAEQSEPRDFTEEASYGGEPTEEEKAEILAMERAEASANGN